MPLAICLLMHIDREVVFIFYGYGGCGLYIYIYILYHILYFVCFFGLSSKKHRCSWHVLWQNSEPVCRLVDKHVENDHRKIWMVCYVAMCLVTVFFVSKLPAYSYNRIFKKSAKKTSKSLCSKSSLYYHDFKTKFRISKHTSNQKGYDFMASSHFLSSFHMPKVINPPWVGRPRIRRFLLSLG